MKVTQLARGRARIRGSLDPKAMLFSDLPAFTHFLWGSPILGDPGPRGMRPGNEVSHSQSLSDWFRRNHGSQARPGGTLAWDSPARARGNEGLSFSRKVAEPPENGASTDKGAELERQLGPAMPTFGICASWLIA